MIKLLVTITALLNVHYLFNGDIEWYVRSFCHTLAILSIFVCVFIKYDNKKTSDKSLLAMMIILLSIDCIIYWPLKYGKLYFIGDNYTLAALYILSQILITIPILYCISIRNYSYKGDKITVNNIYLCLKRADTNRYILTSLIGSPFGSVSVYANNNMYGLKWSQKNYLKRYVDRSSVEKKYIIFDTGIECKQKHIDSLDKNIGRPASFLGLRIKCLYIIKDFLSSLGADYKPRLLENIPSLYVRKLMGVRK